MAILAGDFKTGLTLIVDGDPCQVMDFQHVKPGKGPAFVRIKRKNLRTGAVTEDTFNWLARSTTETEPCWRNVSNM